MQYICSKTGMGAVYMQQDRDEGSIYSTRQASPTPGKYIPEGAVLFISTRLAVTADTGSVE